MAFISNFADQAVLLPLAVIVALGLGLVRWWRGLAAWTIGVVGAFGTMLALKILCLQLAPRFGWPALVSPSGHVAAGCMVYGGLWVLLLRGRVPGFVVAAVPVASVAVIGISRIALGAHTPLEVAFGAVVGLLSVAMVARLAGARPNRPVWPLLAALSCTMFALHGVHMPAEQVIRHTFGVH